MPRRRPSFGSSRRCSGKTVSCRPSSRCCRPSLVVHRLGVLLREGEEEHQVARHDDEGGPSEPLNVEPDIAINYRRYYACKYRLPCRNPHYLHFCGQPWFGLGKRSRSVPAPSRLSKLAKPGSNRRLTTCPPSERCWKRSPPSKPRSTLVYAAGGPPSKASSGSVSSKR
jgi:hypothetical protein